MTATPADTADARPTPGAFLARLAALPTVTTPGGQIVPRPFLQASFAGFDGVHVQSFALLRVRDGHVTATAICDCEGDRITRYLCADSLALTAGPAFRATVRAILAAGPAAPFAPGTCGPVFEIPADSPAALFSRPLFATANA